MSWQAKLESQSNSIPASVIGHDKDLVRAIQEALISHGYLDPPSDAVFGPVTFGALSRFAYVNGLALGAGLTQNICKVLIKPLAHLPQPQMSGTWIDKIVQHYRAQKHYFSTYPGCVNIFYVEGCNPDGKPNNDAPNQFNDIRGVFGFNNNGQLQFKIWEGTTEPGTFWTINPMNPQGAARIAFGQYKAWQVGIHGSKGSEPHEALVQTGGEVRVHRDLNKDYSRKGETPVSGYFGINQHWGYDEQINDLGQSSAGCLVGRSRKGHKEFMGIVKSDPRYKDSQVYKFYSTVLLHPGSSGD